MKRILAIVALLVAGSALAIQQLDLNLSPRLQVLTGGLLVGRLADNFSDTRINQNRETRSLGGQITWDVANATIVCEDSPAITIAGAQVGDPCFVGIPATLTAGGTGLHHSFTCYVSAANAVKVRACAAGTADNPGSVTYNVRVISSQ